MSRGGGCGPPGSTRLRCSRLPSRAAQTLPPEIGWATGPPRGLRMSHEARLRPTRNAVGGELGVDPRNPVDPSRALVDLHDPPLERLVRAGSRRRLPLAPRVVAAGLGANPPSSPPCRDWIPGPAKVRLGVRPPRTFGAHAPRVSRCAYSGKAHACPGRVGMTQPEPEMAALRPRASEGRSPETARGSTPWVWAQFIASATSPRMSKLRDLATVNIFGVLGALDLEPGPGWQRPRIQA